MVIAIIAILAGMLLPALSNARAKARQINCVSNLKQFGNVLLFYQSDYDCVLPPYYASNGASVWYKLTDPYIPYIIDEKVASNCPSGRPSAYTCPSVDRSNSGVNQNGYWGADAYGIATMTYGINQQMGRIQEGGANPTAYKSARFKYPTELVAFADAHRGYFNQYTKADCNGTTAAGLSWGRHAKTLNCLFLDGHAKSEQKIRQMTYDWMGSETYTAE